jgi:hypothetical protein
MRQICGDPENVRFSADSAYGLLCHRGLLSILQKGTAMAEKSNKQEANAQFAKLQRADDAKKAMLDYENEAVALRKKTERLKALRLARDAAAPSVKPAAAKQKSEKKGKGTLSEFLAGQAKEGRNT